MKTLLLFVQQLKAKGLYAADDPPLVANQLYPEMPHISRPRKETQRHANTHKQLLFRELSIT